MIAAALALLALPQELTRFEYRRPLFGIEARVVLHAPDQAAADGVARGLWRRADKLDLALSDWRDDGVPATIARAAGSGAATDVPRDTYDALRLALDVAEASGGAFDPSAGPLTHLWRAARVRRALPARSELDAARALVGWQRVEAASAQRGAGTVTLAQRGMALDFGGIGKGLAAGELLDEAARRSVRSALVELGGDVALGAPPPDRDGWVIEIDGRTFELANCAVATSGADSQHFDAGGRRWSHVVDPRTGLALTHARGATVIARSAALADALASAATVLTPPEAEALVASFPGARLIHRHDDWVELFDGASLAGWTTTGGRYDGDARWSVEDGAIVGRPGPDGEGGLLYTDGVYSAFEFEAEVRLDWPFDSGLFVHMLPRESGLHGVQLTLDHRPGGEIAALYADRFLVHNTAAAEHFARDAWNHVRLRVTGFDPRFEAWIGDVKVLDHTLEDAADFARHGRIGLQVHEVRLDPGDTAARERAVRFRRVRVRELPVFGEGLAAGPPDLDAAAGVERLSEAAREAGWRDLAAGGLDAFERHGASDGYALQHGVLSIPRHGSGHLATREDFGDFDLSLDFRLAPGANSGLFLRAARDGNPAYRGFEIQLIDDDGWEAAGNAPLEPGQRTGSLYGVLAAPAWKRLRRAGEWNRLEVTARGSRIACALDGLVLWDVDLGSLEADPPLPERPSRGFVGFQRYGHSGAPDASALEVKNLFVRER